MKTLAIHDWKTVDYPPRKVGSAEIATTRYKRGTYLMERVDGYDLYKLDKPITIHVLRIDGEEVMVDDPLHWHGMRGLAEHAEGNVLIGGLGLGLILHHMVNNAKVTHITVVEKNPDVITAVADLLPKDDRIEIVEGDIFDPLWVTSDYNTVIVDIFVCDIGQKTKIAGSNLDGSVNGSALMFEALFPNAKVFVWGSRIPKYNPAVSKMTREYAGLLQQIHGWGVN